MIKGKIKEQKKGKLITFEGVEGSGKTTQLKKLAHYLKERGIRPVVTREPGGTLIGKRIRSILLEAGNSSPSPLTELFLYLADRAQHVVEVIIPAIENGKIVLSDRFSDATVVYQGMVRRLGTERIKELNRLATKEIRPDLTILLDLDPQIGLRRAKKRLKDNGLEKKEGRFEEEPLEFHMKIRKGYMEIAKAEPERFLVIDAGESKEAIFDNIVYELKKRFPGLV